MAAQGFLLIATFLLVLMVLARPLGSGLARLINDIPLPGTTGVERVLFSALGVSDREMNWKQYLSAILGLNILGLAVLFFMLLGQHYLPLNPQQLPGLSWDLALNTAVSFVTNTNWQSYSGETTLSYFSQMAGLTVQNFLSAASGIAVIFALIRAFTRQSMSTLGNAWVDLLRITLWVLTPVALLIALFFIQQGALQNFLPYQAVTTIEGAQQLLPMGPVASQEAIKMLGTNGGGFFNANSSHPFENPTALTNFVQMLAIFLIPTALCFAFGEVAGDRRQGRMLLWAMSVIFVICVGVVMWAEVQGNPHLLALGADSSINMEGKESRFGVLVSSLFAVVTTAASCGAVIAMHDSFTALGGMVPMWLMQIGEVVFGGVGSGLYGMMLFVLLAVFIAGLMIGRTPEYLGKKIDVREMKLTALAILVTPTLVLMGAALAMMTDAAQLASLADETPEGRSIVILAKQRFNLRERDVQSLHATFVPFTAQSRMSGINIDNRMIRKGSVDAIRRHVEANGGHFPADVDQKVDQVARQGATPLVVVEGSRVLGVIALKDIVKGGIKERFAQLRKMGIKTVMITGDNRLTAAAIAAEAGVDDFLAEATPEAKLALIRQYQAEGRLVAMTGDGTNDAPALAQADVAVAMNSGTQAAKEAGNMVDLDSNPTKLIEVVHIGKQMLMTRGSLTTFSIANDVAKYFAIIPAAFAATYPQLNALNIMRLHSPDSAILSAVIFNALIIVFLIPLALKGVSYKPLTASAMLRRNLWIYGLGGLLVPFIGIKVIDLLLTVCGLV